MHQKLGAYNRLRNSTTLLLKTQKAWNNVERQLLQNVMSIIYNWHFETFLQISV